MDYFTCKSHLDITKLQQDKNYQHKNKRDLSSSQKDPFGEVKVLIV